MNPLLRDMNTMDKLEREDLFSLEQYAEHRADFRARVLEHKKNRRVTVGDHLCSARCISDSGKRAGDGLGDLAGTRTHSVRLRHAAIFAPQHEIYAPTFLVDTKTIIQYDKDQVCSVSNQALF